MIVILKTLKEGTSQNMKIKREDLKKLIKEEYENLNRFEGSKSSKKQLDEQDNEYAICAESMKKKYGPKKEDWPEEKYKKCKDKVKKKLDEAKLELNEEEELEEFLGFGKNKKFEKEATAGLEEVIQRQKKAIEIATKHLRDLQKMLESSNLEENRWFDETPPSVSQSVDKKTFGTGQEPKGMWTKDDLLRKINFALGALQRGLGDQPTSTGTPNVNIPKVSSGEKIPRLQGMFEEESKLNEQIENELFEELQKLLKG